MKEIKKYQALDGTLWDSEEECTFHEKLDVEQMYEWAMKIKAHCNHMENCKNCPFKKDVDINGNCLIGLGNFIPENWEVADFESDE